MKKLAAAFVCSLVLGMLPIHSAKAVSGSSDYSGLWWNESESGWGLNVIQQEQILFITLFVYGTEAPTWFVGSNVAFVSANAAGDRTYSGQLFRTAGTPFFQTPFNPAATTANAVGTITFVALADGTATLQYSVNANNLSKTLVRQTWARPNFTLNTATPYAGASAETGTGCANPANNGRGNGTISQIALYINGSTMRLELTYPDAGLCILHGNNYVQEGRYGKATLTGTCANFPANPITFHAREVEVGANYFTLQSTSTGGADSAGCSFSGTMVGVKK
jgi:hypothetical protein